jgi:hypothetical protein
MRACVRGARDRSTDARLSIYTYICTFADEIFLTRRSRQSNKTIFHSANRTFVTHADPASFRHLRASVNDSAKATAAIYRLCTVAVPR